MRRFQQQRGLSLVSTMMALGISAIVLLFVSQLLVNSDKMMKSSNLEADRLSLAASIRTTINCDQTFTGSLADPITACASPEYFALRDSSGTEFLPDTGKTIGSWDVRARCHGTGFEVRAAKIATASKSNASAWDFATATDTLFQTHPLRSNQRMNWNWDTSASQRHILINIGELCQDKFATGPAASSGDCVPTYVPCVDKPKFKVITSDIRYSPNNVPLSAMGYCVYKSAAGVGVLSSGSVTCPVGWRMLGGGVNCGFVSGTVYSSQDPAAQGGILLASEVQNAGRTYIGSCCSFVYSPFIVNSDIVTGTVIPSGQDAIWAICTSLD
jgi:hypothetical protein